jgi:Domain of unknown function (DUF4926)
MAVATSIPELAIVEFTHDVDGHPKGAVGVVVSAYPREDVYTVELVDAAGRTVDLVSARSEDLQITRIV